MRSEQEFFPGEWLRFRVVIGCLVEQLPLARKERSSIASGAEALSQIKKVVAPLVANLMRVSDRKSFNSYSGDQDHFPS